MGIIVQSASCTSGNALAFTREKGWFVDDLFVLPESRGTGVVNEMFKKLSKESAKNGWPFVRWITAEDNYRGRGVYDRTAEKTKWVTYQMSI